MIDWKKSAIAALCVAAIGGLGGCERRDDTGNVDDMGDYPSKPTGEMTGDEATGAGDVNDGIGASGQVIPGGTPVQAPVEVNPPGTTTDFGGAPGATDFGGGTGATDFGNVPGSSDVGGVPGSGDVGGVPEGSTDFGGANGHDLGAGSGSTGTMDDDGDDTPRPSETTPGFEDTPGSRGTGTGSDTPGM